MEEKIKVYVAKMTVFGPLRYEQTIEPVRDRILGVFKNQEDAKKCILNQDEDLKEFDWAINCWFKSYDRGDVKYEIDCFPLT